MKKKFLTFILCICFIVPAMFLFSACSQPHFRGLVDMINQDQTFAKNHFNSLIERTTREDFEILYNGNDEKMVCSNTKKYIYKKVEGGSEYLMLYQIWSSEIYELYYNENDIYYSRMDIIDSNQDTEYEYIYYVKNHLHAIYDIESITATAKEDCYFMNVEFKNLNFEIQYQVNDNKISRISYDNETMDLLYYPNFDFDAGVDAEPFSNVKTLWIDEDSNIKNLNELFLHNIETIYLHQSCDKNWYIVANFEQESTCDSYIVYKRKTI